MTDFKPSELPVGTVIKDEDGDQWTKEVYSSWVSNSVDQGRLTDRMANAIFDDFEIVSVPWSTAVNMAIKLQDEYGYTDAEGEDITIEGLIKSALDETVDLQAKLAADKRLDDIRNAVEAAKA